MLFKECNYMKSGYVCNAFRIYFSAFFLFADVCGAHWASTFTNVTWFWRH